MLLAGLFINSCSGSDSNEQTDTKISKVMDDGGMEHKMGKMANCPEMGGMENTMGKVADNRVSLNLLPKKAQHQLKNMREHLEAVRSIIFYLSKDEFDSAATASSRLGLSDEMKMMCSSFGNEEFERLGLEFHKSADRMSETIKTKNKEKSLESLSLTMNYCISCHSVFKQ